MDALKDWLLAGPWTVHEAACLIAGVLPPERRGDTRDFGGVLPGREVWQDAREAWREIVAAEVAHIEALLKEQGVPKDATPQGFLSLALRLDKAPPWLDAARGDAESRAFLPSEALEGQAQAISAMMPSPADLANVQRSGRMVSSSNLIGGFILWRLYQEVPRLMPADAERKVAAVMKDSPHKPPRKRWIEDLLCRYRGNETPRDVFAHNVRKGANSEGITVDKAEETAERLLVLQRKKMPRE